MSAMHRVLVFDVNETLLDLSVLDPHFERLFGAAHVKQEWFDQLLLQAMTATLTGHYRDFGTIGRSALEVVAFRHGRSLRRDDLAVLTERMRTLPAHPDVRPSLDRLAEAGFRLAALTNSANEAAHAQLDHASLRSYFETVLSVDAVHRFKPAAAVYEMAATSLGVAPGAIRMVAAHAWDVTGALRAGCAAAFVARPGTCLSALDEHPDIVEPDLNAVTDRILERDLPLLPATS